MLYINEIYNGNVTLSDEDVSAINAYVNIIRDNTSFMNANKGMIRNQLGYARNTFRGNNNRNLVNAYIIRANEAMETRVSKIDSSINALDSIIQIIENGLTENSTFYNNLLSNTYKTQNNTNTDTNLDTDNNLDTNTDSNLNNSINGGVTSNNTRNNNIVCFKR